MTNWIVAIVIGIVIGGAGGLILGRQYPAARWMAPVASLVGALIAAALGAGLGHNGTYGWKKASLQIVLALAGVGVAAFLARRNAVADQPTSPVGS